MSKHLQVALRARSVLFLLLIVSWPVGAQQSPLPQESAATETVEVRLVQLALLARDRQGRPVTDLTAEGIVVKENGRKMRVASLEPFAPRYRAPVPQVRLFVSVPGADEMPAEPPPGQPRYVVLFVDAHNDYRLLRHEAAEQVMRFAREDVATGDRVAVFAFDGELHLEQSFTANRELVVAAVARAYDRPPRPALDLRARMRDLTRRLEDCAVSSGSVSRGGDESCLRGVAVEYVDEVRPSAEEFLAAIEWMIRFVGGLSERVTVLALTHGVAVDPMREVVEAMRAVYGNTDQLAAVQLALDPGEGAQLRMDELIQHALRSRAALHFVDRSPAPSGDFDASVGEPFQAGARPMQVAFDAARVTLEEMARHTGGTLTVSADVLGGLRQAMALERGGYLLSYYADSRSTRASRAKVRVSTRRKGVRLLHRRGYLMRQRPASLIAGELVLGEPLPLTGPEGAGQFVPFTIVLVPRDLGYAVEGHEAAADFTLHVRVETSDGRSCAESFHFVRHAYPRETWEADQAEPVDILGWTELPPGDYRIIARVSDPDGDRSAEFFRELTVPEN